MHKKFFPAYLLILVNVLGFTILLPVLPFIVVEDFGAPEYVYGLLLSSYSLFQFIGAPFLGKLSDSKGRKKILLISQAGTLLSWIIFGLSYYLPIEFLGIAGFPLIIIAFSRMLDGVTGGNTPVAEAYIADITTPEEKKYIFSYTGGIAGLGLILGPGLGGLAASTESLGSKGAIIFAGVVSLITFIAIQFFLKESLPPEKRRPYAKESFSSNFRLYRRIVNLNPPKIIKQVFLLKALFHTMMSTYISTIVLFMIERFSFTEKTMGAFMLVVGIFISFNQVVIAKRVMEKLGDNRTLQLGLALCCIGLFTITLTDNLYLYIALYYVLNLGLSLCFPSFNTILATRSPEPIIGEVMGISNSIASLANTIFPVLATLAYSIISFKIYWVITLFPLLALWFSRNIKEATKEDALQPAQPSFSELEP
jgi:MFS family permease